MNVNIYLDNKTIWTIVIALMVALVVSFITTPPVNLFAHKVGAIDVPNDARRVHKTPIPRLGGLAIFFGFIVSVLIFADISRQIQGILLGAVVIVVLGVIDDIVALKPLQKFLVQIIAAIIPVYHGVVIDVVSHPNIFSDIELLNLTYWAIPVTIIWIVGVTNAVNFIDGLDGLAVGVSTIASVTMLIIAVLLSNGNVAIILAALAGACIGFMPYNVNPAKIFMGDTGALLLGFLLSTLSVVGLFKFYAIISFIVPFLAMAMPIFDTATAIIRRLLKHQSPMQADRGHLHHRLLDRGLNQKQAVFVIYVISTFLGLLAVALTTKGELRIIFTLCMFVLAFIFGILLAKGKIVTLKPPEEINNEQEKEIADNSKTSANNISPENGDTNDEKN